MPGPPSFEGHGQDDTTMQGQSRGSNTPISVHAHHPVSARAPCWLRANARGQGAQGCSPQNCPLCRDQGEEGEEWVWLGKFEESRQCASYIIFMSFRPRTTLI